eukprot:CAMPEP_0184683566 /NCGR_PEP_ID=MMETSP0312-20130426/11807_1 /TAXON_ID=31354 /ORGANISM="Compsopogon coeruleus, Strain SAG 36.94" /LENGTH=79 /DNA_ID=CAMNT_0027136011 /DNA_START=158 /DNA_END=397 /DNA_ORIENTATION=-
MDRTLVGSCGIAMADVHPGGPMEACGTGCGRLSRSAPGQTPQYSSCEEGKRYLVCMARSPLQRKLEATTTPTSTPPLNS